MNIWTVYKTHKSI